MLLCYRKYRVLEIVLIVARIDDPCQLENCLALSVLDPKRSRPDTPLVHQEQQSLRWRVAKPELWSQHVADRLRYFRSGLVEKMLVAGVERGSLTEHFLHHSIVCLYRVYEFLAIRFIVHFQCGPTGRKLYFPAQLSLTGKHINFSLMPASFQLLSAKFHPVARVSDHMSIPNIF